MKTLQELQSVIEEKELIVHLDNLVDEGIVSLSAARGFYSLERLPDILSLHPIEKEIVDLLRPKSGILLGNTQSGKTLLTIRRLLQNRVRSIPFIVSSNDQGLCSQLTSVFQNHGRNEMWSDYYPHTTFKTFLFSHKTKADVYLFQEAALRYQQGKTDTIPIAIFLNNTTRLKQLSSLINLCGTSRSQHYSIIFDEADQTYPNAVKVLGQTRFQEIRTDPFCLQMLGVTATAERLKELWPEAFCLSPSDLDDEVEVESERYRAMHTKECDIKLIEQPKGESANLYAKRILSNPWFKSSTPVGFRKILVKANVKIADQRFLAAKLQADGFHTIVVNMNGVEVNGQVHRFDGRLNVELYQISQRLLDKPLVVIGNRKIDRGVTFHYIQEESLIFTDMILPNMENADAATQAAGRLAGNIARAKGYIGSITYWTTEKMQREILSNNRENLLVNQIARQQEVLYVDASDEAQKRSVLVEAAKEVNLVEIKEKLEIWARQDHNGARFLRQVDVEDGYTPDHPIFETLQLTSQATDMLGNFNKNRDAVGGGGYGMFLAKVKGTYFFIEEVKPLIRDFQESVLGKRKEREEVSN